MGGCSSNQSVTTDQLNVSSQNNTTGTCYSKIQDKDITFQFSKINFQRENHKGFVTFNDDEGNLYALSAAHSPFLSYNTSIWSCVKYSEIYRF
jgi:hypothetical protein